MAELAWVEGPRRWDHDRVDTTVGRTDDGGARTFEVTGSRPRAPFGPDPVPEGIDVVEVDSPAGPLTAFLAASGVPERGRVLMVPGYTGSKEDFTHFIPRLTAPGYAVLAYSQRGQADSAAPRGRSHYRLDDFVGDLLAIASPPLWVLHPAADPARWINGVLGWLFQLYSLALLVRVVLDWIRIPHAQGLWR